MRLVVSWVSDLLSSKAAEFVLSQLDIKTNLDRTKWMETSIKISLEKDIRKGGTNNENPSPHHTFP